MIQCSRSGRAGAVGWFFVHIEKSQDEGWPSPLAPILGPAACLCWPFLGSPGLPQEAEQPRTEKASHWLECPPVQPWALAVSGSAVHRQAGPEGAAASGVYVAVVRQSPWHLGKPQFLLLGHCEDLRVWPQHTLTSPGEQGLVGDSCHGTDAWGQSGSYTGPCLGHTLGHNNWSGHPAMNKGASWHPGGSVGFPCCRGASLVDR